MKPITVIGAANVDLCGTSLNSVVPRDSNPGRVRVSAGGVGRNIAESLARLGLPVRLITALGRDEHGEFLARKCREAGIDLSLALWLNDAATSCYLCVNDNAGDLVVAVNDMEICNHLTPGALEKLLPQIDESELCVIDANLPNESIDYLARNVNTPLAADPVSTIKAERLIPALGRMAAIKPNLPEAEKMTGLSARDAGIEGVAVRLHDMGCRRVFISLGAEGAYYLDDAGRGALPCVAGPVLDTTGCGDAFLAAALEATVMGLSAREAAKRALAGAALRAAGRAVTNDGIELAIKDGGIL